MKPETCLSPCILGTHHEKGAHTFWSVVNRLPLSSNAVLCWKFCHVFHKLLRDGHPNVLKDSVRYKSELSDMSRMWNPRFPGNLQMSDRQLDETGENDVNNFFQLTVEMFDYLECELNLFQTVFSSLDMSRSVSVTAAGQCRLAPLIQVILDCSHLYDYTVKLLFKLHSCNVQFLGRVLLCVGHSCWAVPCGPSDSLVCMSTQIWLAEASKYSVVHSFSCLPADTLQGHRDRFLEQFKKLKDLFYRSSNLQYFKRLIQIPQLPENPPNFLRASALSEHISPVVVIPLEASSPDSEPIMDLVEMETSSQKSLFDNKFDDIFGSSFSNDPFNFNSQNGMTKDDKDRLIEQLHREMDTLKDELKNFKAESHRLVMQLKGRISELEAELEEQKHLKQQALDESDFLRTELDEWRKRHEDTEKAQRSLTEIERKAQTTEQRYVKLKEKYSELVQNHADLLRKNAEVTKQVTMARQVQSDTERDKKELEDSFQRLSEQAQRKTQEQAEILETLKRELIASKQELQCLQSTVDSTAQFEAEHTTHLAALKQEKDILTETMAQRDQQMTSLEAEVQQLKAALEKEEEYSSKTIQELQNRLGETEGNTQALQQELLDKQFVLLQCAVKEAEQMVQDALNQLEDPTHISSTSSADYLLSRTRAASECVERLQEACGQYLSDQSVLLETSKQCGSETMHYLGMLKDKATLESADCAAVRNCLNQITSIGQDLRPKGLDVEEEKLGDLVDEEMAATAAAVEIAAARIEEMLNKSRAGDRGVKFEVNERILGSCTDLMQAIQVLVLASKDLQQEIVESGRGAASPKEFYARNSRWTEGLISASKAVGWGATVMVDAADLVVQGNGKFEELMVCSHEIAASTAQLVAASKVRVLELESQLQKERQRLGELRKKHYELGGVAEGWDENGAD
ncbi:Huntingtin-interacting protein 1 [Ophiophagus hannah]|uniref:Huntingtin-interacting protein 1 n=1 Tax=Ophiophagus hannah TaxID=8665 RepID=V8PI77_OPHHA|nr:Huntingtin-interacting protein 1 [Ophiophagus hannah]